MKCDHCDNEATVHEWTKAGGQRHLCEPCAVTAGLPVQSQTQFSQIVAQSIASLIKPTPDSADPVDTDSVDVSAQAQSDASAPSSSGTAPAGSPTDPAAKPPSRCPSCTLELAQFRSTGLLGCPDCYCVFQSVLAPLIERSHEGATHHTGKTPRLLSSPRHAGSTPHADVSLRDEQLAAAIRAERLKRIDTLRLQLADAVAAEQYERAARLRDEVARVECEVSEPRVLANDRPGTSNTPSPGGTA